MVIACLWHPLQLNVFCQETAALPRKSSALRVCTTCGVEDAARAGPPGSTAASTPASTAAANRREPPLILSALLPDRIERPGAPPVNTPAWPRGGFARGVGSVSSRLALGCAVALA